jgi:hypothetical protein
MDDQTVKVPIISELDAANMALRSSDTVDIGTLCHKLVYTVGHGPALDDFLRVVWTDNVHLSRIAVSKAVQYHGREPAYGILHVSESFLNHGSDFLHDLEIHLI